MTINKIIEQEKDKAIVLLLKQLVSLKWSKRFVENTIDEIKNLDLEKADDEQKKQHSLYKDHMDNIDKTLESLHENALAYKDLSQSEDEIKNLLKI